MRRIFIILLFCAVGVMLGGCLEGAMRVAGDLAPDASKGAGAGFSVGGPIGGAIGAILGGIVGWFRTRSKYRSQVEQITTGVQHFLDDRNTPVDAKALLLDMLSNSMDKAAKQTVAAVKPADGDARANL